MHSPDKKILRNSAKCLLCGDEIESRHRHDIQSCSCGNLTVDGGKMWRRRSWSGPRDSWVDTIEYEESKDA